MTLWAAAGTQGGRGAGVGPSPAVPTAQYTTPQFSFLQHPLLTPTQKGQKWPPPGDRSSQARGPGPDPLLSDGPSENLGY